MDPVFHCRFACCAQWVTTCSHATDQKRPAVAGWRWITRAFLLASWAVTYLASSMRSTATPLVQNISDKLLKAWRQRLRLWCMSYDFFQLFLQFWRQVYLLTVLSLILAVFSAQVHPNYLSNDWKLIRVSIFCCVAGVGVIPACHWIWLNGGFASDIVKVSKNGIMRKRFTLRKPLIPLFCSCFSLINLFFPPKENCSFLDLLN